MKRFLITIFMAVTIFSYSNTTSTPNYEEAKNFAYASLGCHIGGSVLESVGAVPISIFTLGGLGNWMFAPPFIIFPVCFFSGLILNKILAGVFSIYSNYLIYGNTFPTINSAILYGLSWIPTLLLTIPGYFGGLISSMPHLDIVFGILIGLGTLLSIAAQAGSTSIPLYVLKL